MITKRRYVKHWAACRQISKASHKSLLLWYVWLSLSRLLQKIIIVITLCKCQIFAAEHRCSTNWWNWKSNELLINSYQIKCWFLKGCTCLCIESTWHSQHRYMYNCTLQFGILTGSEIEICNLNLSGCCPFVFWWSHFIILIHKWMQTGWTTNLQVQGLNVTP